MPTTKYALFNTASEAAKVPSVEWNAAMNLLERLGVQLPRLLGPGVVAGLAVTDAGGGEATVASGVGIVGDPGAEMVIPLEAATNVAVSNGTRYIYLTQDAATPIVVTTTKTPAANTLLLHRVVYSAGVMSSFETYGTLHFPNRARYARSFLFL